MIHGLSTSSLMTANMPPATSSTSSSTQRQVLRHLNFRLRHSSRIQLLLPAQSQLPAATAHPGAQSRPALHSISTRRLTFLLQLLQMTKLQVWLPSSTMYLTSKRLKVLFLRLIPISGRQLKTVRLQYLQLTRRRLFSTYA